jgi:rare lipoprotein A
MITILLLIILIWGLDPAWANKKFTGIASWYGGKFQGRKTASGEIYDMNKLTAAHKHLKLGTKLKVTNKRNGKSVIVKINDRGPFVGNRVLDLSRAAAKKLNFNGLALVDAEIL